MIQDLLTNKSGFAKTSGIIRRFYFFTAVLFLILSISSCTSTGHSVIPADSYEGSDKSLYIPENITWQSVCYGADYFYYENKDFPLRYHCVRIDLTASDLEILTFPSSQEDFFTEDGKPTEFFKGMRAGKFAKTFGTDISINTSPFAGKDGSWNTVAKLTSTRKIVGIHISDRQMLSEPSEQYAALLMKRADSGYEAEIIKSQKETDFSEYDFAFGGFFEILKDYKKIPFSWVSHDSRTAVGISEDKKTLYILVVEGEFQFKSKGLSYPECADVMLSLGACNAMEMDGGGSSSLFIKGNNMLSYPSIRISAAYLGFKFHNASLIDDK